MSSSEIFGFEDFVYEQLSSCLNIENLNKNKELAIISVPLDFDVNTLRGQRYIPNASCLLDKHDESSTLAWEMQSKSLSSDVNILLPSTSGDKNISFPSQRIQQGISIIQSVSIPPVSYPKKNKNKKPMKKPDGLRTRWKPFGEGDPLSSVVKIENTSQNQPKQQPIDIPNSTNKKKKKNKKKMEVLEQEQKTKKSKSEKSNEKQNNKNLENITLDAELSESDLDSDKEAAIFGMLPAIDELESHDKAKKKKRKHQHIENNNEVKNTIKKKKKKKTMKMEN